MGMSIYQNNSSIQSFVMAGAQHHIQNGKLISLMKNDNVNRTGTYVSTYKSTNISSNIMITTIYTNQNHSLNVGLWTQSNSGKKDMLIYRPSPN